MTPDCRPPIARQTIDRRANVRPSVARRFGSLAVAVASALVVACSGASAPAPVPPPQRLTFAYLVPPADGYPSVIEAARAATLDAAFEALRANRLIEADDGAAALLDADPAFHPATVLRAQAALVEQRAREAIDALTPIVEALPSYRAAHVVRAFAAEAIDDVVVAFESFAAAAETDPQWGNRAQRLQPRAIEILMRRLDDALVRGRVEEGEAILGRLERWAPMDLETAEAAWWVSVARNDEEAERAALDVLLRFDDQRRDVLERLAALEIAAGALQSGLARYEALIARFPDDVALLEQVERARFRWRLSNLPKVVGELAEAPELSRADFATLAYWLVPEVRYARLQDPPIATDILTHPRRDEIVRVVNLDLLRVDETVHRFRPERPIERRQVLEALLTLMLRSPEPFACLDAVRTLDVRRSVSVICETAARCGLLVEEGDCLPTARVAGDEALDLFRRTLDQLGG